MSNLTQISKNLKLTQKLLNYIVHHSEDLPNFISTSNTYVVISNKDKKLNETNHKLIKNLRAEGRKVIKAKETGSKNSPWVFAQA